MSVQNAACNRETQSGSAALKFRLATGVQVDAPELTKLFKDCSLVICRNTDTGVRNCYFNKAGQGSAVNRDRSTIRCELYCVVNYVSHGLHNAGCINVDPFPVAFKFLDC